MLTRLVVRNFKRFEEAAIDLGDRAVVLIGPNNSGKTTALQALAVWHVGLRAWLAKREGKASPKKRPGVAINRQDLLSIPVPAASMLWRDLHVRNVRKSRNGKTEGTQNIRVDVEAHGTTGSQRWSCGLEFDYSNEESLVCRPLRKPGYDRVKVQDAEFSEIPEAAAQVKVAYLPPMSGLTAVEPMLQPGRVAVLLGEGQTAQVLRNLCHQVWSGNRQAWSDLAERVEDLFGAKLSSPQFISERGEITMQYEERGARLDLSCSGRGLQQTLLLLAHMYANPGSVLLLDEPDAHLEILRQRQTYNLISEVAAATGSQIIAASHSEVILNEAAGRDVVVAFVGKPHRIDRASQTFKALADIGFDQYYQAEQTGWVLYLESPTDLLVLRAFARRLGHPAGRCLDRPFVHYVENLPRRAEDHFFGLREAKRDLVGLAIFDRLDKELQQPPPLREMMWSRREIENYFCCEHVVLAYANQPDEPFVGTLFEPSERQRRVNAMREAIRKVSEGLRTIRQIEEPWSPDVKATDDVLDPVFRNFFELLKQPLTVRKADYHRLIDLLPVDRIDPEVREKLDAVVEIAARAVPAGQ